MRQYRINTSVPYMTFLSYASYCGGSVRRLYSTVELYQMSN